MLVILVTGFGAGLFRSRDLFMAWAYAAVNISWGKITRRRSMIDNRIRMAQDAGVKQEADMNIPKTNERTIQWLLDQASGRQCTAAVVHARWVDALGYVRRSGDKMYGCGIWLEGIAAEQHSAAYHAAVARECLLAALQLQERGA
jgi:hypothetical protein